VPFHVEIRRSHRRAWAFNFDEERLRRTILDPWRRGEKIELGDREWDPRESELRIIEGAELPPEDLAFGRGWNSAERSGRDVAAEVFERRAIEAANVTIVAETAAGDHALAGVLGSLGVGIVNWNVVREWILGTIDGGEPPEVAAAVLVVEHESPEGSWLFDAGLALAAFKGRVIVAQLGEEPTPRLLAAVEVVRLDPEQPAAPEALAERLRLAGCPIPAA
jgi:hypothetical protein